MAPLESPAIVTAGNVRVGDGSLTLIAGPCVIESEAHAIETALALRDMTRRAGVPFVFKASYDKANRTSGTSFRGPGLKTASASSGACARPPASRS